MSRGRLAPTPQQKEAITAAGKSLLVSAAAGSGKTSVLAQRCVHLICDAKPRCNVNQLLVVTFTEAAAMEMKTRIEHTLRERLSRESSNPHLERQLSLIDHAHISTLHSFCARIIRQNFQRLEIDPAFTVMDRDEAALLRLEVARDLFMKEYDRPDATAFRQFIDDFGEGKDEGLIQLLVRTYEMIRSLVEPQEWLTKAQGRIAEAAAKPLKESELGREYLAMIETRLRDLQQEIKVAGTSIAKDPELVGYVEFLRGVWPKVTRWQRILKTLGYDALVDELAALAMPRLPPVSDSAAGKSAARAQIDSIRDQIKHSELRFTSKEWQEGLRSIEGHVNTFISLIEAFAKRYSEEKKAARGLDFADLERNALKLLCEGPAAKLAPSPVARLFHKQFQHVLVDEYQDINEIQDAILSLVSRERVVKHSGPDLFTTMGVETGTQLVSSPNLFCVGDVKQSIYGFRLADPTRFLGRMDSYRPASSHGRVIDLQSNFRSRKPLLDAINNVFENLMTRDAAEIEYDQSHRLVAGADFPADAKNSFLGAPIEFHILPAKLEADEDPHDPDEMDSERSQREAMLVARRIEEMMGVNGQPRMSVSERDAGGQARLRPIEYRDMVILLRATKFHSDDYSSTLRQRNIPVFNDAGGGFFEAMEIRDILSLLRLLDNERQDIPLAAVLRSPLISLPTPEDSLARIRLAYPTALHPIQFHEAAAKYALEQDDELAARLRDFYRDLSRWRTLARQQPIAQLIWTIYEQSGYLAFCSGLHDGRQRVANLIYLHEKARTFGNFSRQGLYRFIQYLESIRDEFDSGQSPQMGQADNAVRIMSIHKAKGLEFPVVFVPELGKRINFQSCLGNILADRRLGLGLTAVDHRKRIRYPSLASVVVSQRLRRQILAEEMRVLYVAMTRAKEHLILSGTCNDDLPEEWMSAHVSRTGALPPNMIQSARTILDWVGPVWAMQKSPTAIELHRHASSDVREWLQSHDPAHPHPAPPENLAQLKPLASSPPLNPAAKDVIDRLTSQYRFANVTKVPASSPVTALAKSEPQKSPSTRSVDAEELADPPFLLGERPLSPRERGDATHLFLEHVDFSLPPESLSAQLSRLVDRRILSPAQSQAVNLEDVKWLLESPLGQALRKNSKAIIRELSLNVPSPGNEAGLDRTMLRGRIDLLVPDENGFTVIDYKTDDVRNPGTIDLRAQFYTPQVRLYGDAIKTITGKKVHTTHLVFLAARQVYTIPLA